MEKHGVRNMDWHGLARILQGSYKQKFAKQNKQKPLVKDAIALVKELSRTTHAGLKRSRFTIEARSRTSDASRQASQHKATIAKNSIPKVSQKFCNRRFLHCNRCFRFTR